MKLLEEAIALHQAGDLDAAEQQYHRLLEQDPAHPDALHLLGLIDHARGDFETALKRVQQAIDIAPQNGVYFFNLGNIFTDQGDTQQAETAFLNAISTDPANAEYYYVLADLLDSTGQSARAVDYYEQAIERDPSNADLHLDSGACLQGQNQLHEAIAHYQAALSLEPTLAQAHNNLGGVYQALGEMDKAASCYRSAITYKPELAEAHRNYAAILETSGDTQAALNHYEAALRLRPDYDEVAFKLAALRGEESPASAPADYVRGLFDQYAEEFDDHLTGTLGYQTPQRLRAFFEHEAGKQASLRILDLGCGTGLSGIAFQHYAGYLAGVDLSPRMIDKAKERGIYDELHCDDLIHILDKEAAAWGLIVAVDVLIYIGDLEAFMHASSRAMSPGGWLLFSVEQSDQSGYVLRQSGRYAHSMDYLEALAKQAGLVLRGTEQCVLRQNFGKDVTGYLLAMQKP